MSEEPERHDDTSETYTRRGVLYRFGQWSLGVAAATAGVLGGARPAQALPDGCCTLVYGRFCTGQEWSQGCGYCGSSTDEVGYPTGKWWWSCPESGRQRFCGECWNRSCSYTYLYSGSPVSC